MNPLAEEEFEIYPGGDLVRKGLADLAANVLSEEALLVLVAKPRLEGLGFSIPVPKVAPEIFEHALFSMIELRCPAGALSDYNSLIQRIVSFANACDSTRQRS